MTQAELAERLGLDVTTVSRWERGANRLSNSSSTRLRRITLSKDDAVHPAIFMLATSSLTPVSIERFSDFKYLFVNKAWEKSIGVGAKEVVGKDWREVYQANHISQMTTSEAYSIFLSGEFREIEYVFPHMSDARKHIHHVSTLLETPGYPAVTVTSWDILLGPVREDWTENGYSIVKR